MFVKLADYKNVPNYGSLQAGRKKRKTNESETFKFAFLDFEKH